MKTGVREVTHGLLVVFALGITSVSVTRAVPKPGADLFKQAYVYLIRGDEKFASLASNYIQTLPSPDSMFVVEVRALDKMPSDTFPAAPQYLNLSVKRPMSMRIIVADSTTSSLIAFDFKNVPSGEYSIGTYDWPTPLRLIYEANRRCSIFFAVDQKYQGRYRFERDPDFRMLRIEKTVIRNN